MLPVFSPVAFNPHRITGLTTVSFFFFRFILACFFSFFFFSCHRSLLILFFHLSHSACTLFSPLCCNPHYSCQSSLVIWILSSSLLVLAFSPLLYQPPHLFLPAPVDFPPSFILRLSSLSLGFLHLLSPLTADNYIIRKHYRSGWRLSNLIRQDLSAIMRIKIPDERLR